MVLKIRFSHQYLKLPFGEKTANLLGIQKRRIEELPADFLDYDTEYWLDDSDHKGYYQLPEKGDVLVLFFWAKQLFTTIRRWLPEKEEHYRNNIGSVFEVVIE